MSDLLDQRLKEAAELANSIRAASARRNHRKEAKANELPPKPEALEAVLDELDKTEGVDPAEAIEPKADRDFDALTSMIRTVETKLRDDVNGALDDMQNIVDDASNMMLDERARLKKDHKQSLEMAASLEQTSKQLRRMIDEMKPKEFIIRHDDGDTQLGVLKGRNHYKFDQLVKAASVRGYGGHRKNILLKGPAGSGKSTAGVKLAELLKLDFTYIGQTLMPHTIEGYVRQGDGEYQSTPFVDTYRNGGVLMMEEVDGWSPQAVLVANPALANGHMVLPNGEYVTRHKDCVIIACANTWGTGATTEYVGRNKLDAAFLDRFGIRIDWGYDDALERAAANNDDLVTKVQFARMNAEKAGIKIIISPRASIDCADMVRCGFSEREAFEVNFLSSLTKDQRKTVLAGVDLDD